MNFKSRIKMILITYTLLFTTILYCFGILFFFILFTPFYFFSSKLLLRSIRTIHETLNL